MPLLYAVRLFLGSILLRTIRFIFFVRALAMGAYTLRAFLMALLAFAFVPCFTAILALVACIVFHTKFLKVNCYNTYYNNDTSRRWGKFYDLLPQAVFKLSS